MIRRVVVHQTALDDIERNARWWAAHRSHDQAERWYAAAFEAVYGLDDSPESHGLSAENEDFPFEIRDRLFGLGSRPTHRAVFTVAGRTVHVLTVRSVSQDAVRPDEFPDVLDT